MRSATSRRRRPPSTRCAPRPRRRTASSAVYEREISALRANAQDQAGEIARLKAALAAFEQQDGKAGGLKDSKIALKARLGSAQAQADQQTATIAKLRAELAATHERLARQAAHFMGEMRRIGTGGTAPPAAGAACQRGARRATLAERVAQVGAPAAHRRSRTETRTPASPPAAAEPKRPNRQAPTVATATPSETIRRWPRATAGLPQKCPKPARYLSKRRRPSLIDRITGLGKG